MLSQDKKLKLDFMALVTSVHHCLLLFHFIRSSEEEEEVVEEAEERSICSSSPVCKYICPVLKTWKAQKILQHGFAFFYQLTFIPSMGIFWNRI